MGRSKEVANKIVRGMALPAVPVGRAARKLFRRRSSPPGTSPGTLARVTPPEPTTLSLITYDEESLESSDLGSVAEAVGLRAKGSRHWLRVVGHDPAVIEGIGSSLGVHPLVLEDILSVGQRPKAETHAGYLFVVTQVLRARDDGSIDEEQVSILLFQDLVVTIEERANELFRPIEKRLSAGRGRIRGAGADYLAYALIDAVVDYLFPLLDVIGDRVEAIEAELLEDPSRGTLERLHEVKRELLRIRRVSWPMRETLSSLIREESEMVSDETRVFMRDVYDHSVQVLDMVETFREMSTSLVDLYLSSISNRMNEVMKVLTIIATIFIPLTFIAGIYGMNFDTTASPLNMPELKWPLGYPFALGLMAVIAGALLLLFRRKGWL